MKQMLRAGFYAACMAVLLPVTFWMLANKAGTLQQASAGADTEAPVPERREAERPKPEQSTRTMDADNLVWLEEDGKLRQLPLRDYLVGVIMGELPPSFISAAVEAQAVAARTFTLRQLQEGKHDGYLCDNASCCQAWLPESEARARMGDAVYDQWYAQVIEAIDTTDGQVLTYDGTLIDALFFSCSGGRTEAAAEVWGGDVPYLVPVDSPGEESAPRYCAQTDWPASVFREAILAACPEAGLSGSPETWLGEAEHTSGGGVARMRIGEAELEGTALRSILGLNSTLFTMRVEGENICITTYGSGHRVGLSQYGAQAMAQNGADYCQILMHYYPGAELTSVPEQ